MVEERASPPDRKAPYTRLRCGRDCDEDSSKGFAGGLEHSPARHGDFVRRVGPSVPLLGVSGRNKFTGLDETMLYRCSLPLYGSIQRNLLFQPSTGTIVSTSTLIAAASVQQANTTRAHPAKREETAAAKQRAGLADI